MEDLIEPGLWLEAVNRYVSMYGLSRGVTKALSSAPSVGRIAALPDAIRKEKIAFAYNVLELVRDDPARRIVRPDLTAKLRALGQKIGKALQLA